MKRKVHLTDDVRDDLFSIYDYLAANSFEQRADQILSDLHQHYLSLDKMAERGHFPPELNGHQLGDIRELRFKPYRIIYRIEVSRVVVLAIFDGRRDAQSLIEQRTFRK